MRIRAWLACLTLISLLLMAVAVIPHSTQAAWSDSASLSGSPDEVSNGESVTFSFDLTIPSAKDKDEISITAVTAQFEWDTRTLFTGNEVITRFPTTLNYKATVTIPADLAAGTHVVIISVTATEDDDEMTTADFTHRFRSTDVTLGVNPSANVNEVIAPGSVSFAANAVGGTPPYTYAWTFGDGGTGYGETPSHTYTEEGTYTARVTVTDRDGRTASGETSAIRVSDISEESPFKVTISPSATSGTAPLTVDFTSLTSKGEAPYTYLWQFGDGTTGTEAEPTHVYDDPGTYDARLTIIDSYGEEAVSPNVKITVSRASGFAVDISASEASGNNPLAVQFSSTVTAVGTTPYFYHWNFGDGTGGGGDRPIHTYSDPGTYRVTLTITDSNSRTIASDELDVTVSTASTASQVSWDWNSLSILIWAALFVVAGLLLMKSRK